MTQGEDLSLGLNEEDREEEDEDVKEKEKKGVTVSQCGSAMVEIKGLDLTASHQYIGTNQVCDVGWNENTSFQYILSCCNFLECIAVS